jgi:hypothetical protein
MRTRTIYYTLLALSLTALAGFAQFTQYQQKRAAAAERARQSALADHRDDLLRRVRAFTVEDHSGQTITLWQSGSPKSAPTHPRILSTPLPDAATLEARLGPATGGRLPNALLWADPASNRKDLIRADFDPAGRLSQLKFFSDDPASPGGSIQETIGREPRQWMLFRMNLAPTSSPAPAPRPATTTPR